MRLYLSSFRLGNRPDVLVDLMRGGKRAGVIMNAGDAVAVEKRAEGLEREIGWMKDLGLEPSEVDLRDFFGKPDELRDVLQGFDMLWVRGGNCFILRRAFRQSGADEVIKELLLNDALVYAGYSAAIDMLIPSLHGAELVDNPNIVPEGYEAPIIWDCLNLLPYAVAPHYRSDHPESADVDKSVQFYIDNHMLFKALRDGQAIVVDGASETVVG